MLKRIRNICSDYPGIYSIVFNSIQIIAVAAIFIYFIWGKYTLLNANLEFILIGVTVVVVIWGAALDIKSAFMANSIKQQAQMLHDAYDQLEELNVTLRSQRHDFMNHFQVVYSLIELGEYSEARHYIERVYDDIQQVNIVLKTRIPAINALLAAKLSDCEESGIRFDVNICSDWSELPIPGWEMCRVLGNLIDNAIEAVIIYTGSERYISVTLSEDINCFSFVVENSGYGIPDEIKNSIFQMGFSTKHPDRGMGLHIVTEILSEFGGSIELDSTDGIVKFRGSIPKSNVAKSNSEKC